MPGDPWTTCATCGQLGRVWAAGAPGYGCSSTLADRDPGEIVTLGNGERARILWHMPRRRKKVVPQFTFLGMIDDITDIESYSPIGYPSCIGVLSVDLSRMKVEDESHEREKSIDYNDPIHRQVSGRLI